MSDVGGCCLCISLYHGCMVSAAVTVIVSICQTTIFSVILFMAHNSTSYTSGDEIEETPLIFLNDTFSFENETENEDAASYSFSSKLCPFGFVPLEVSNKNLTSPTLPLDMDGLLLEGVNLTSRNFINMSIGGNVTTQTRCMAPGQGMLVCMIITSTLYGIVGGILYYGVKKGISEMLSVWFFYTVGYNILAMVVCLLDGVYTGAADISTYSVCAITVYCIVIVDSYYEKVLLGSGESPGTAGAGGIPSTFQNPPSLSVVKSSPQSEIDPNARLLQHNGDMSHDDMYPHGDEGLTEPFLGPGDSTRT